MDILRKIISFLKKIQNQPKHIRKIIFWAIIIIIGTIFLFTWIQSIRVRIKETKPEEIFEELKPPTFKEDLENIPDIGVPEFLELSEEELRQLEEELMKETEKE